MHENQLWFNLKMNWEVNIEVWIFSTDYLKVGEHTSIGPWELLKWFFEWHIFLLFFHPKMDIVLIQKWDSDNACNEKHCISVCICIAEKGPLCVILLGHWYANTDRLYGFVQDSRVVTCLLIPRHLVSSHFANQALKSWFFHQSTLVRSW